MPKLRMPDFKKSGNEIGNTLYLFTVDGHMAIQPNSLMAARLSFVDEAIMLLGEAIEPLGHEAIRLYGHMAVNTEVMPVTTEY